MATEQDKPVDREAWRRLLEKGGDAPPALTDARIRAAARRALAPRARRWWLPASLAASLLLAVLLVQWQYGEQGPPAVISESDYAAPAAEDAASRQDAPAPPAPAERRSPSAVEQPTTKEFSAADESSADATKRERDGLSEITVDADRRHEDAAQAAPATPVAGVTQQSVSGNGAGVVGELRKSREVLPAPEDWYASIEDLRAAGRHEEADRELERLEAAYPGWLEKNRPPDR
ncbi:MAG TPA: hypothetical protein VML92_06945 [Steroidobacteraceae bacterium]|nr:hypothetical protein [Steroidobacteraceae bacterium]